MTTSRRRWAKRIGIAVAAIVVVLAALLVAGQLWVGPAVVRSILAAELPNYWEGSHEVDDVEFSYFGPIRLHGVRLRDAGGRTWVDVPTVVVELRDWPGTHPVLTAVGVEAPSLSAHLVEGRFDLPVREPPPGPPSPYVDIRQVDVSGIALAVVQDGTPLRSWKDLEMQVTAEPGGHRLKLQRPDRGDDEEFDLTILFAEPPSPDRASLRLKTRFSRDRIAELLSVLRPGYHPVASGRIDADVSMIGPLGSPQQWQTGGEVRLNDCEIATAEGSPIARAPELELALDGTVATVRSGIVQTPVVEIEMNDATLDTAQLPQVLLIDPGESEVRFPDLDDRGEFWSSLLGTFRIEGVATPSGKLTVAPSFKEWPAGELDIRTTLARLTLPLKKPLELTDIRARRVRYKDRRLFADGLRAQVAGGAAGGTLEISLPDDGPPEYELKLVVHRVDISQLAEAFGAKSSIREGKASGALRFFWRHDVAESVRGAGDVVLDDTNLSNVDLLTKILRQLNARLSNPLAVSDVRGKFKLVWPIVTISEGEVASSVSALKAEPGGTANLDTHQVDAYVLAVPLRQLQVLKNVPVIGWLTGLQSSLVRFRVKGDWNDPPEKLIRVEPLEPLAAGVVDFFRIQVTAEGQIQAGMLETLGDIFIPGDETQPGVDLPDEIIPPLPDDERDAFGDTQPESGSRPAPSGPTTHPDTREGETIAPESLEPQAATATQPATSPAAGSE